MEEIKLTPKQIAFCEYYVANGGNATNAALEAGYSESSARQIASENLSKHYIIDYIEELNASIKTSRIADMVEVKEFWTDMFRSSEADPKDRLKASEYLAKTNAAFVDKVQHSGNVQIKDPLSELTTEEIRKLLNE